MYVFSILSIVLDPRTDVRFEALFQWRNLHAGVQGRIYLLVSDRYF